MVFEVNHSQEGQTSPRLELRKNLANMLKVKIDLVFVGKMETKTGTMTAVGEANAYETHEQAKLVEPEHIIARNQSPKEPAETEQPKKETSEELKPAKEEEPKAEERTREVEPNEEEKEKATPTDEPGKEKEKKE